MAQLGNTCINGDLELKGKFTQYEDDFIVKNLEVYNTLKATNVTNSDGNINLITSGFNGLHHKYGTSDAFILDTLNIGTHLDTDLSISSTNGVQNKVIKSKFDTVDSSLSTINDTLNNETTGLVPRMNNAEEDIEYAKDEIDRSDESNPGLKKRMTKAESRLDNLGSTYLVKDIASSQTVSGPVIFSNESSGIIMNKLASTNLSASSCAFSAVSGQNVSVTITGGNYFTGSGSSTQTTPSNAALQVNGGINVSGGIGGSKIFNAVWNDIADFVEVPEEFNIEYGKAYTRNKSGEIEISNGGVSLGIASDTYGYAAGVNNEKNQMPIAIGGWVLAYVDKIYDPMTPLRAGENGVLTRLLDTDRDYLCLGFFDRVEPNEEWNGIRVNGRCWVKVK